MGQPSTTQSTHIFVVSVTEDSLAASASYTRRTIRCPPSPFVTVAAVEVELGARWPLARPPPPCCAGNGRGGPFACSIAGFTIAASPPLAVCFTANAAAGFFSFLPLSSPPCFRISRSTRAGGTQALQLFYLFPSLPLCHRGLKHAPNAGDARSHCIQTSKTHEMTKKRLGSMAYPSQCASIVPLRRARPPPRTQQPVTGAPPELSDVVVVRARKGQADGALVLFVGTEMRSVRRTRAWSSNRRQERLWTSAMACSRAGAAATAM